MLKGFCRSGQCDKAMSLFSQMKRNYDCVVPDCVTYNTLVNGFCKAKRLVEARVLFEAMKKGSWQDRAVARGV